jgi:hypothetical protein
VLYEVSIVAVGIFAKNTFFGFEKQDEGENEVSEQ